MSSNSQRSRPERRRIEFDRAMACDELAHTEADWIALAQRHIGRSSRHLDSIKEMAWHLMLGTDVHIRNTRQQRRRAEIAGRYYAVGVMFVPTEYGDLIVRRGVNLARVRRT